MTPDAGESNLSRVERAAASLTPVELELWSVALAVMLLDVGLTVYGIEQGLTEMNPIVQGALAAHGVPAVGALKGLALGVALSGRALLPARLRALAPVPLVVPWLPAVVVNALLLFA